MKKYTKKHPFKIKKTSKTVHITKKKDWSNYVLPSTYCQSDNKKIIKLSKKIIKKEAKRLKKSVSKLTDKQKANAILNWEQKNFKYGFYGNTKYGALKSLSKKKLNCVDSSHITIALLRLVNIPAKDEAKVIKNKGHCWVSAYFGGKWNVGEPTDHDSISKFEKCGDTLDNWVKKKADSGTHINSYEFTLKYSAYGKQMYG